MTLCVYFRTKCLKFCWMYSVPCLIGQLISNNDDDDDDSFFQFRNLNYFWVGFEERRREQNKRCLKLFAQNSIHPENSTDMERLHKLSHCLLCSLSEHHFNGPLGCQNLTAQFFMGQRPGHLFGPFPLTVAVARLSCCWEITTQPSFDQPHCWHTSMSSVAELHQK